MNFQMFVPLLALIAIATGLGAIPGAIAKRKHRSRAMWWIAGAIGFPIALVGILCFRDLDRLPDEQKAGSGLKEKIVVVVIFVVQAIMVAARLQPAT
jgi:hypothetical protein